MRLVLNTEPAEEPITTAEAKAYLRVDAAAEDALISSLIKTARIHCEEYTGRAFVTQTWDMWLDAFPAKPRMDAGSWWDGTREGPISSIICTQDHIELPKAPFQSLTSLVTYDDGDTETAFSASNMIAGPVGGHARLTLKRGQIWPVNLRTAQAVRVRWVAGYGAAASVPDAIKTAILMSVAHLFENRGDAQAQSNLPVDVKTILQPYRIIRI